MPEAPPRMDGCVWKTECNCPMLHFLPKFSTWLAPPPSARPRRAPPPPPPPPPPAAPAPGRTPPGARTPRPARAGAPGTGAPPRLGRRPRPASLGTKTFRGGNLLGGGLWRTGGGGGDSIWGLYTGSELHPPLRGGGKAKRKKFLQPSDHQQVKRAEFDNLKHYIMLDLHLIALNQLSVGLFFCCQIALLIPKIGDCPAASR